MRVGLGFDVHPFGGDKPLVLAGVTLDGPGLHGHSDADVVAHAVADALLGAAGLGDIGEHFPDTDPQWQGADSMAMLRHVAGLVAKVVNVDCSVVLEAPRLAPYKEAMAANLSAAVDAPVSVKAKRAEGLGAIGRGEGIACWAVALVEQD
jgi:2-C-methyl-D-erythritol 2,4-cyclodiphosphate synthase